jgi:hypothetical protein
MLRSFFWSWLRRLFFGKPAPLTNGRRALRRLDRRRLGIEGLEDRTVPAVSLNQAFVASVYQGLLDRPADASGLAYWSNLLNGGASTASVVTGITNSSEFMTDQVQQYYTAFLRRTGSSSDLGYWVKQKQAGATWQQIEAGITGSDEYFNKAGGNLTGYVTQMFQDFIHRRPAAYEFGYFQSLVAANTPRTAIALNIIQSPEGTTLPVLNDYRLILSRDSDSVGLGVWLTQLRSGADVQAVENGFIASPEYINQLQQFINQGHFADAGSAAQAFIDAYAKFGLNGYTILSGQSNLSGNDLVFEPNVGQAGGTPGQFQFLTRGNDYSAFLTESGPVLSFESTSMLTGQTYNGSLQMELLGNNANAAFNGIDPLPSTSNYFVGPQSNWMSAVANFGGVEYHNVYSGIDLIYQGTDRRLQHNFVVNPGADPGQIAFTFPGYKVSVNADGSLTLVNPATNTTLYASAPHIFQADGKVVSGGFVSNNDFTIGYQVGAYDHSQALIIDPTLVYSTFVGGSSDEGPNTSPYSGFVRMALDGSGNTYVATSTTSSNFPTTTGAFTTSAPNSTESIAVFKLNSTGTALVYSTYLGNSNKGVGAQIAIDSSGHAFVSSEANDSPTTQYPTTSGAYKTSPLVSIGANIVASELSTDGTQLLYSTFIAGAGSDNPFGITVDSSDNMYITGEVNSKSLPATSGAYQTNSSSLVSNNNSAYIVKLNPGGNGSKDLIWATYVTGSSGSQGNAIGLDNSGNVYIGGQTTSSDFPTTSGALETGLNDSQAGFVSEISSDGSKLVWSTYVNGTGGGGSSTTTVNDIAVDSSGNVFFVGTTNATDLPTSSGAYKTTAPGGTDDAYVGKLGSGAKLTWLTYLGTSGDDKGNTVTFDASGNVYVGGSTDSDAFPNLNPIQTPLTAQSSTDGFVTELNSSGTGINFSTNFGGLATDRVDSIKVDGSHNIYIAGDTTSNSGSTGKNDFFTTTTGAFQTSNAGKSDVFVAKINAPATSPPPPPPGGGGGGGGGGGASGGQVVVSTSDLYSPNSTSDKAHDFGSLAAETIFSYDNLQVTSGTNGEFHWFKWEASQAGTFYVTLSTTSGGPLEMHLFTAPNNILTNVATTTGGNIFTSLAAGQAVYVEVKGSNTSPGVMSTGTYNIDLELQ